MTLPLHSTPLILIASTDAKATGRLKEILTDWRYPVRLATDGISALKILVGQTPPGIALLDAGLPMLNGIELVAEVRRKTKKRQTWTMLMSEQVDIAMVASATDAGIDDLLLKPVDAADLRVRLLVAERVQGLMSQLDEQIDAVRFHASHDSLTGLWNRESLLNLLFPETDRVQRMRTPLTLLLLDLDHFSAVNVDYGYEAGDKILQELGNRFRRFLRSYDLIGRCGEDEFMIALPGCTSEQALSMAMRVKKTILEKPFAAGRDMLTLTASMGIAQSRGRSPLVVLREAERALSEAKQSGRNVILEYCSDRPIEPETASNVSVVAADRRVLMPFPTER
jgi:two-component system, cell cycle response regulator